MLKTKEKILGLDFGDKSIGLSLYDVETDFFSPFKTIYRERPNVLRKSLRELVDIIIENNVSTIVIGIPFSDDGGINERSKKTIEFKDVLKSRLEENKLNNVKIELINEFNTTNEAKTYLKENGFKGDDIKKNIDTISALIILKDYIYKKEKENGKK